MKSASREEVMAFLWEADRIYHLETNAELVRWNFGVSWALAYCYADEYEEVKNAAKSKSIN